MARFAVFTRIAGEDGLSSIFRKVGDSARSAFAPIQAFNKGINAPDTTALGRVGSAVDRVSGKFRSGLGSLTSWLPALGALGTSASLAGLIAMTRKAADGFDGMATSSEKLGVTMGWLSGIRYGAKQTNLEAEALEKGLVKLKKAQYDAATGKNADAASLFKAMGINLRNAKGQVKGLEESLEDIAEVFARSDDEEQKAAASMVLFGKSGVDLLPFLNLGRDGIRKLREENKRFSSSTDEQKRGLIELDAAYKRMEKAGSGLASRISVSLAPALSRVVNFTTDWIVANREFIGQYFDRKVLMLAKAFDFVRSAAEKALSIPFVGSLVKGADMADVLNVSLAGLGVTMAGPVFAGIQLVTKAWWGMTLAMLKSPIFWIPAVIAGAAYAIYANWGPITEWFGEQMDAVKAAFDQGFVTGLIELWKRFNVVTLITTAINGLSKWLFGIDLFDAGRNLLQRLMDGIKSLLPDFEAIWAPIDRAMSWVGQRFSVANADTAANAFAGEFGMPGASLPSPPSPGSPSAMAIAGGGAPQRAFIGAEIRVKAEPGTVASVATERAGVDQLDVGQSVAY